MDLKSQMILEEYRESYDAFKKLGDEVHRILKDLVKNAGIEVMGIEHRVKEENSLAGKLERNNDMYTSLADLTDILGARIICYFEDEVDVVGKLVEETFTIDWENSVDKRAKLKADTFGYLSLHYIAYFSKDSGYPEEICEKKFEIQIRTILQHAWAAINHDIGYKNEFGVPREVARDFSRVAGLLEVADKEFVGARDAMKLYESETRIKIANNEADDISINSLSLREYNMKNNKMREFIDKIATLSNAEINEIDPESFLPQLSYLGKKTLGDLKKLMEANEELALKMAKDTLEGAELDILASTVGLRFLCRAELINKGYDEEQIAEFLKLSMKNEKQAQRQAKKLIDTYRN